MHEKAKTVLVFAPINPKERLYNTAGIKDVMHQILSRQSIGESAIHAAGVQQEFPGADMNPDSFDFNQANIIDQPI